MTIDARERMLDLNERLCKEYNETEDPHVLEQIAVTEVILFNDPDHVPQCELFENE